MKQEIRSKAIQVKNNGVRFHINNKDVVIHDGYYVSFLYNGLIPSALYYIKTHVLYVLDVLTPEMETATSEFIDYCNPLIVCYLCRREDNVYILNAYTQETKKIPPHKIDKCILNDWEGVITMADEE